MNNDIKILDCTLRDGGYVNNWNFSNKDTKRTIRKLLKSNIEIVECGFLDSQKGKESDRTRFKTYEVLENLVSELTLNENQLLVAMVDLNSYDLATLPKIKKDSKVTGIRLAYRRTNYLEAIEQAKILKEKGFQVFMQPMSTVSFSNKELKDMLEKINTLNPYAVYIVDTSGSMYQDTFLNLFEEVEKTLNKDIKLGFHSHNNLQLSYAIAIDFINSVKAREIIIDSSVYGMGRGAGNLNTELLADYLNKKYNKDYKIENILELIDSYFNALHKNFGWGYSLAHFLSASNETHPNYASYLLDTKRLSINEIKALLEKIPNSEKYEFDKDAIEVQGHKTIEKIYQDTSWMDVYKMDFYKSKENHRNHRENALKAFVNDFNKKDYVFAKLPNLPFENNYFDLALSSHLLFVYDNMLDYEFHKNSILEMLRVSKEVRIFPLVDFKNSRVSEEKNFSPFLYKILEELKDFKCEIVKVDFEFQPKANYYLKILK